MGRPNIAYLNECRASNRERGITKSKWKAPKVAPPDPPRKGQRIPRSYALLLAFRYHKRRQAEIEDAKNVATLDDFEIPF